MPVTEKRTFCRVCEPACGLIATVEGDQLLKLEADKDHPISKGFVCNKGIYGADVHNDPDRLNQPLKKVGPGQFEPISWDQAVAEIADRLQEIIDAHGGEAVGSYTGNPERVQHVVRPFLRQLHPSDRRSDTSSAQAPRIAPTSLRPAKPSSAPAPCTRCRIWITRTSF